MSKKSLPVENLVNELHGASAFFQQPANTLAGNPMQIKPASSTPKSTRVRHHSRGLSREVSREENEHPVPTFPSRDDIQEFSFRLRDELKVKVQAEVPYRWQDELEEIARQLKVKKLELYRYILGEFLGKVKRKIEPN